MTETQPSPTAKRSNDMTETQLNQTAQSKWGWFILIGVSSLLVLNGLALYFIIEERHSDQTVGLLLSGVGLFGLVLSIGGFRLRSSLAWNALWVLGLTVGAIGAHLWAGGSTGLGVGYLGVGVIVVVGLLLARSGLRVPEPTAA